jgi:DNA-binding transcriptional ArsR family regulator
LSVPRPSATEDVFRAVADPTRRAALELLGRNRDLPVGALAEELGVGLPMLSRHLAVLRAAGLVSEQRHGRQRRYRIEPEPLRELYDWAAIFGDFWPEKVDNLRFYLDRRAQDGRGDDS